jgi:hypothetical protein
MTRLTTEFWVQAYLKHLNMAHIPAYVLRHGDDTAGTVLIKVNMLDGQARVYAQTYDLMADRREWALHDSGAEQEIDDLLSRQAARDPDLWTIEIESPSGIHLLELMG